MKNAIMEMDSASLKNNFERVCGAVNGRGESAALHLASGRTVFILPEENYDKVSCFLFKNVSANTLTR